MSRTNDRFVDAGLSPSALTNRLARIPKTSAVTQLPDELAGLVQPEVALAAQLDEVVEEADDAQRRGEEQHQQRRRRDRLAGQPVRDEVTDPDGDEDRDAAHRRRAALGLVALRPLVADLLAEALPREEPDQVRGEQDRDRERHARGDEDAPHATGSRFACVSEQRVRQAVQTGRPRGLHQHDVAGRQLGVQQRQGRGDVRDRPAGAVLGGGDGRRARPPPARRRRRPSRHVRPRTASPSSAIRPSTAQVRRGRSRPDRSPPAPATPPASTPGSRCRRR